MSWLWDNFWLFIFLLWGLPLGFLRSRFRKIVYQTDNWLINIKPVFIREFKGLLSNLYPEDKKYLRVRNQYRLYLGVYILLFFLYKANPTLPV